MKKTFLDLPKDLKITILSDPFLELLPKVDPIKTPRNFLYYYDFIYGKKITKMSRYLKDYI